MSNEFVCKICNIICSGKAQYDQHLIGSKHFKKLKSNELQSSASSNTNSSSSLINTRTNTTSTPTEYFPVPSSSVSISSNVMRILLEWNHPQGYKPYCDKCQLPLYGGDNADIHFESSNDLHNQKLAAWKQIRENDAKYHCKVCSEIFSTENQMTEHFNSDNHETIIQQKDNLQKIIDIYETYTKLKQVRREANSAVINDDVSNRFQLLNVIDATITPPTPKSQPFISHAKFSEVMRNKFQNDDDDD